MSARRTGQASRPDPRSRFGWFGGVLPLETETAWFVLVNVLDIVMTWMLLYYSAMGRLGHNVVESNPVAGYFLNHWGVAGMNYFKLGVVAVVILLAQVIAIYRLETARWLLKLGTLVVCGVVVYSVVLLLRLSGRI